MARTGSTTACQLHSNSESGMRRDTHVGNVVLSSGPLADAVSAILSMLRAILHHACTTYRRLGLNAGLSAAGSSEATESFLQTGTSTHGQHSIIVQRCSPDMRALRNWSLLHRRKRFSALLRRGRRTRERVVFCLVEAEDVVGFAAWCGAHSTRGTEGVCRCGCGCRVYTT